MRRLALTAAALATSFGTAGASAGEDPPAWTQATQPFHIVGPIWYVGTQGLAAYLIKTSRGAIVLDGTLAANVPAIERNIATVGVRMRDVKLLLLTHAHFDHAGGLAGLYADSGAAVAVGAGDADAVRTGVPPGLTSYGVIRFPAVPVARAVGDGEEVQLGGTVLTAHATPGHTPGCTSWSMRIADGDRPLDVLFVCSLTVAGNRLNGNTRYPGIVADYRRSFATLAALHADVLLPAHPELADVLGRQARGGGRAFVAPGLLPRMVARARRDFETEAARAGVRG